MKARVFITLKNGVLDPQGKAIHHALEGLGFSGVNDVRAGKLIELDLAEDTSDAQIEDMCRKLLANTVIERIKAAKGAGISVDLDDVEVLISAARFELMLLLGHSKVETSELYLSQVRRAVTHAFKSMDISDV